MKIEFDCYRIPIERTGFFSKLVTDYIQQSPDLSPFYQHRSDLNGIADAISARDAFDTPRSLLVEVLKEQNHGLNISEKVAANIDSLKNTNVYTVTTAHQPNIFTGPLYFIYKILHAVKLADQLNESFPDKKFVPVYYMGSEDADLDELGEMNVDGNHLRWETGQTGAVGRMKVDQAFLKLIRRLEGQIGVLPYGPDLIHLFKRIYEEGKMIQQATLELVNELFADFGVVVLVPDHAGLKRAYRSVIAKELTEQFSHRLVTETITQLKENYKVQTAGRALNLFYLMDQHRERIEKEGDVYFVKALGLQFNQEEILSELDAHPERFSANVILRGGFQETVLPNIAFIGGGGELAYWIELKKVFASAGIPYPVLLLRNSFLILQEAQLKRLQAMGFEQEDLFKTSQELIKALVLRASGDALNIDAEKKSIAQHYHQLQSKATAIDPTLKDHVAALHQQIDKKLAGLEKKMLRAQRLKFETSQRQIESLKASLFPGNSLQERVFNFSSFYANAGKVWMQMIYEASNALEMEFTLILIK